MLLPAKAHSHMCNAGVPMQPAAGVLMYACMLIEAADAHRPTMILYGINNIRELSGHKVSWQQKRHQRVSASATLAAVQSL